MPDSTSTAINAINWNPLSFDQYFNLGDACQKACSSKQTPNIVLRICVGVCAKIIGRIQEVALHMIFGSLKLTISTAMAIYSVPAAIFDYTPNHYNLAKQGIRHITLSLFYVLDIPLSFANVANKYPQSFAEKIQKKFKVALINLEIDAMIEDFDDVSKNISQNLIEMKINDFQKMKQKVQQLEKENSALLEKNQNLLQDYALLKLQVNI